MFLYITQVLSYFSSQMILSRAAQNSTSVAETEKGGQNSTMTPPTLEKGGQYSTSVWKVCKKRG